MERHKYNEMSKLVTAVFDKYGYEAALNRLNSGIAKAPHLVEAYLVRGELYMERNDFQMALNDFEKAIMINPNEPEAYFLRGLLYVNFNKDIDNAIKDFSKSIELDANHVDSYVNRANVYLKKSLLQKASIDCTKAIELSPDRMEPYYYRGLAYSEFGGYTKALEDYNMAISIADESSDQHADTFAKRRIAKSQPSIVLEAIRNAELIHSAKNSDTTDKNTPHVAKISSTKFANIFDAIRKGTLEDVKYFVEQKNIDVNIKDSNGRGPTPLHIAAACGNADVVVYLISNGADVNARAEDGHTPLHSASSAEVVKILLSAGADVNARDSDRGFTPLHMLMVFPKGDYLDTAKALIDGGANINAKGNIGDTPLIQAITCSFVARRIELVRFLVSNGADIKTRDKDDWTPIHWAIGDVETAKCLVELGAEIDVRDNKGDTPLTLSRKMGKTAMAEYLSSISTSSTRSSGGCYIATAVYKSYDAPEVLCLRRFRDEILSASILGRLFIRLYYLFSPAIAEKLKRTRRINIFTRKILDKIVVKLNKKFHV
jgi:ankyrin repeat protein/Tfp pilus assembly protein PilF